MRSLRIASYVFAVFLGAWATAEASFPLRHTGAFPVVSGADAAANPDASNPDASNPDAAVDAGPSDSGFVNALSQDFNGSDERVTVNDSASLDSSRGAMSWSAWIYIDTIAAAKGIVSKFQTGVQSWRFQISESGGNDLQFMADTTSIMCRSTSTPFSATTWYHVGAIYNGSLSGATGGGTDSNRVKLCVNGTELTTRVCSGTFPASLVDTTATVEIGARNATQFFDGNIDEVAIYGQTFASCAALYAAVSSSSKPKDLTGSGTLLLWFSMGDAPDSSGSIVDRSGNSNTGTPVNFDVGDYEALVP